MGMENGFLLTVVSSVEELRMPDFTNQCWLNLGILEHSAVKVIACRLKLDKAFFLGAGSRERGGQYRMVLEKLKIILKSSVPHD